MRKPNRFILEGKIYSTRLGWERKCFDCGVSIFYTLQSNAIRAERVNALCKACQSKASEIPIKDRFWKHVEKHETSCWVWMGSKRNGYGLINVEHQTRSAHRISWELHFGRIPPDKDILHSCDNPSCVNPNHLFLGTHLDNMRDMVKKNREAKGEGNGKHKLTEKEVTDIRKSELPNRKISNLFNTHIDNVRAIRNRETWRHLS